jgi:Mn2+/Fe2+ NRAMP family transporter
LYGAGVHGINTVQDAAEALRPLAGEMAYALFAVGVLGTGFLAIPVLGGSLSYMLAEAFNWQEGMNKKFYEARGFYITLIVSLSIGLLILFTPITAVQALIYSAVLYGLVAPVIIGIILHICNNKKIMGEYTNTVWANIWGILTLVVMSAAAIALLYFLFF